MNAAPISDAIGEPFLIKVEVRPVGVERDEARRTTSVELELRVRLGPDLLGKSCTHRMTFTDTWVEAMGEEALARIRALLIAQTKLHVERVLDVQEPEPVPADDPLEAIDRAASYAEQALEE